MTFGRLVGLWTALGLALIAAPAPASSLGYEVWISGTVIAVDTRRELIIIAHGPTETSNAGVEPCRLRSRALRRMHIGMDVQAQVDSRRRPWRILHLRIYEHHRRVHPLLTADAAASELTRPAL